jgi:hypothetical protein
MQGYDHIEDSYDVKPKVAVEQHEGYGGGQFHQQIAAADSLAAVLTAASLYEETDYWDQF